MMNLIRLEWLKLRKYKPMWILMFLYPFCVGSVSLLIWGIYDKINFNGVRPEQVLKASPFAFPTAWKTITYMGSFLHFLPAVIILLSICNEFEFRTHRQAILNGQSRQQLFLGKVILTGMVSVMVTLVIGLTALTVGLVQGGGQPNEGIDWLAGFFLQSCVYSALAFFIGFQMRHGLSSLAFFLIYSNILEKIALFSAGRYIPNIGWYGPLAVANQLVPFPVDLSKELRFTPPGSSTLGTLAVGYILFFLAASWWSFRKRDL